LPHILQGARKHSFGVGTVAAQFTGQANDAVNVSADAFLQCLLRALAFEPVQRLASPILDQNRVFLVSFVAGRGWLEIKADCAGLWVFK